MKKVYKQLKNGWKESNENMEVLIKDKNALFKLDTYRYILPSIIFSVSSSLKAQTPAPAPAPTPGGGFNAKDIIKQSSEGVIKLFDWIFLIIIITVFIVGATGLIMGLIRVFTGRASEGIVSLVVGLIAIVLTAILVGIFYNYYLEEKKNLEKL